MPSLAAYAPPWTRRSYQPWLALAATSVVINGAWEWFALSSYATPAGAGSAQAARAGCLLATLGDVAITLAFYAAASAIGTRRWLQHPAATTWLVYVGPGVLIAIGLEVVNVQVLHRWSYPTTMLVIVGIGILPLIQWLTLPLLVRWSARRYLAGAAPHSPLQEKP